MSVRPRRRGGFTLIEVMVSLVAMMVGGMAVIGLQAHAIRGNAHARRMTIATEVAQRWIERLKQDSHTWTTIGIDGLANTNYLGDNIAAVSPDAFTTLPISSTDLSNGVSNAFDARGRDQDGTDNSQSFCASYRRAWVWEGYLMRVDVRVWWPREVTKSDRTRPNWQGDQLAGCVDTGGSLDPGGAAYPWYHVVYLSTTLRVNEVRR